MCIAAVTVPCPPRSIVIRFDGETPLPNDAGVYAYTVAGVVHYVGSAQRGLRRRLRNYEISQTMRTASRIRQEILDLIDQGLVVQSFTILPLPLTLSGLLPVDTVLGLEAALIRAMRPAWNRHGLGGKV